MKLQNSSKVSQHEPQQFSPKQSHHSLMFLKKSLAI